MNSWIIILHLELLFADIRYFNDNKTIHLRNYSCNDFHRWSSLSQKSWPISAYKRLLKLDQKITNIISFQVELLFSLISKWYWQVLEQLNSTCNRITISSSVINSTVSSVWVFKIISLKYSKQKYSGWTEWDHWYQL